MIPIVDDDLQNDFEYVELPTKTFKLNPTANMIAGFTDELAAMEQAIYLILNVERYEHLIYSWDYGVELRNLFGKPTPYVLSELKTRITEALTQDSRISGVSDFNFTVTKNKVLASFMVSTIYGDIETEKVVDI